MNALIGYSGFVGTTLLKQSSLKQAPLFDALYRSTNIHEIEGREFDVTLCAGAPAQKWIANKNPAADREKIDSLIGSLETIRCKTFILISTVDVFQSPIEVDETSTIDEEGLHPYGLHRRFLEKFVAERFPRHLIVRLPGLVGHALRKNVIFDFLNNNNLKAIDSRGIFQFYPMANLWFDIEVALQNNLPLVHLTAAPITVEEIALNGFGRPFKNELSTPPARYDLRTRFADLFGREGHYQYSSRETVQAVRSYAQSEPLTRKPSPEKA